MEEKKGRVLVTGGAGYVGSHTVVRLLECGHKVVVVDSLANCYREGKSSQPESLVRAQILSGKRLDFHPVDITDQDALRKVFSMYKFDCVLHFAALKSISESCRHPLRYYSNNITGTLVLVKVMLEFGVTKLLYSSSATVYGDAKDLPITECHETGRGCTNPYGKSKYMVEEVLKDVSTAHKDWCVVSLRYFNPVGAHKSGKIGEDPTGIPNNLMPYVAQVAVGKLPVLQVYGSDYNTPDGTGVRDFIHIEDLAEGHVKALKKTLDGGWSGFRTYNLGTGRGHSVLEVIKTFSEVCGRDINYEMVGRREGDIGISYCDANLAKAELGWTATRNLRDMCEDMWRWQMMNPDGYRSCSAAHCANSG